RHQREGLPRDRRRQPARRRPRARRPAVLRLGGSRRTCRRLRYDGPDQDLRRRQPVLLRETMNARVTQSRGFTLTEMLIVMGVIVLVALIAVPSFRALTGGRSTEAASNTISAALARARL